MNVDLSHSNLSHAVFLDADLHGINLSNTNLYGAILQRTDLTGANLAEALVIETDFSDSILVKANFKGCALHGTHFWDANASGADFSESSIEFVDFNGTTLVEANFSNSSLYAVDVCNANLEKAVLTGACLEDLNTNSKTILSGTICEYVYLQRNRRKRRPAFGSFEKGYFSAIFQGTDIDTVEGFQQELRVRKTEIEGYARENERLSKVESGPIYNNSGTFFAPVTNSIESTIKNQHATKSGTSKESKKNLISSPLLWLPVAGIILTWIATLTDFTNNLLEIQNKICHENKVSLLSFVCQKGEPKSDLIDTEKP